MDSGSVLAKIVTGRSTVHEEDPVEANPNICSRLGLASQNGLLCCSG